MENKEKQSSQGLPESQGGIKSAKPRCVCVVGGGRGVISEREEADWLSQKSKLRKKMFPGQTLLTPMHKGGYGPRGFGLFHLFKSWAVKCLNDWWLLQCQGFLNSSAVGCKEEALYYKVLNIKLRECFPC